MASDVSVQEQQIELSSLNEAGTCPTNQIAITAAINSVTRVSVSSNSDEWSSSGKDEDEKQVAEVRPRVPSANEVRVTNTYANCTGISSTTNNTTVYKDAVTVHHNFYCPCSSDCVLKWFATTRGIVVVLVCLMGIPLVVFLGLWLSILLKQPSDKETGSTTESPSNDCHIIRRKDWGAAAPISPPGELWYRPPIYVVFSETGTEICTTTQKCKEMVREIQAVQMKDGMIDIAYNFLVGGDGMVYEGRGWLVQADDKYIGDDDYVDKAYSVSFIGKFGVYVSTETILQAARMLLEYGSRNARLHENQKVKCVRDMNNISLNPGLNLYNEIKTWDGWYP